MKAYCLVCINTCLWTYHVEHNGRVHYCVFYIQDYDRGQRFHTFLLHIVYPYWIGGLIGTIIYNAFKNQFDRIVDRNRVRADGEARCDLWIFYYSMMFLFGFWGVPLFYMLSAKDKRDLSCMIFFLCPTTIITILMILLPALLDPDKDVAFYLLFIPCSLILTYLWVYNYLTLCKIK